MEKHSHGNQCKAENGVRPNPSPLSIRSAVLDGSNLLGMQNPISKQTNCGSCWSIPGLSLSSSRRNKFKGKVKSKRGTKGAIQSGVRKIYSLHRPTLGARTTFGEEDVDSEKVDQSLSRKRKRGVRSSLLLGKQSEPELGCTFPKSTRAWEGVCRLAISDEEIGCAKNRERRKVNHHGWGDKAKISLMARSSQVQIGVKGEGGKSSFSMVWYGGCRVPMCGVRSGVKGWVIRCEFLSTSFAYLNSSSITISTCTFPLFLICFILSVCKCVYECYCVYYFVGVTTLFFFFNSISEMNDAKSSDKEACASDVHTSKGKSSSSLGQNVGQNPQCTPHMEAPTLNGNTGNESSQKQTTVESLDSQLDKIRIVSSKTKSKSLMGYVFGDPIDFKSMKFKLLTTWRLIKGEVQIYDRGHGWFECVFRELHHLQKVWGGRPYHVKGQLLLLKPWRVDFNTKNEDTNVLDLWIRIFNLPPPLACNDGVRLILEENGVGKFIKFDRASGGFFARACVNIDIIKNVPGLVRISDNKVNPLLLVWFEDFPHGCGNCGDLSHVYKNCPLLKHIPKKISINIIRNITPSPSIPEPVVGDLEKDEGWTEVVKSKKKNVSAVEGSSHGVKPYVEGGHGVVVSFISADSVETATSLAEVGNEEGNNKVSSEVRVVADPVQVNVEMECDEVQNLDQVAVEGDNEVVEQEFLMEEDDLMGEELHDLEANRKYIMELENEILAAGLQSTHSGQFHSPNEELSIQGEDASNNSKSDSLKRKGNDEDNDDSATSSLKRKKPSGSP